MTNFESLGLSEPILKATYDLGFTSPTPIQEKTIPAILSETRDFIGLAQTGTGKTAAFGLPILQLIDIADKRPQALILAPTRELCLQITKNLQSYAKHLRGVNVVAIYGGASMGDQISAIRRGTQIIVATPGRMDDLLNRQKRINLSELQFLVLDEADEMLNMGFKDELDAILAQTPATKRTFLFSATMPREVLAISRNYMHDPLEVTIGTKDAGASDIEHAAYIINPRERYLALKRIVDFYPNIYGIVFCRTRIETQEITEHLMRDGYNADALHGDLSQSQRERILNKFRSRKLQILVATDVAARGLDVKEITHVVNFSLPDDIETYTHRSGRTGRAGNLGTSVVLISPMEKFKLKRISEKVKKEFVINLIPSGEEICKRQLLHLVEKTEQAEINDAEIEKFLPEVYKKLDHLSKQDIIKKFVAIEFNHFLEYYKDAKDLNIGARGNNSRAGLSAGPGRGRSNERGGPNRDNPRPSRGRKSASAGGSGSEAEEGFTRICINIGKKDNVSPKDILGLINRSLRSREAEVGRIDLDRECSYFEIDKNHAASFKRNFKGMKFKNIDVKII